jgi:hypothetical protein
MNPTDLVELAGGLKPNAQREWMLLVEKEKHRKGIKYNTYR